MKELEELFKLQIEFQESLGNSISDYLSFVILPKNIQILKNQLLALFSEIGEALQEVPWKPWKQNQNFNVSKFRMELIDVFHFLINLFLYSGMDSNDVIKLFKLKNKINIRRQKDGY